MIEDILGEYKISVTLEPIYPPGFCESEGIEKQDAIFVTTSHEDLEGVKSKASCAFALSDYAKNLDPINFLQSFVRTAIYETLLNIAQQKVTYESSDPQKIVDLP